MFDTCEPASKQEIISHSYATGGEYTAKLSLQNLIGDESERTVTVKIDPVAANPPTIDSIEVAEFESNADLNEWIAEHALSFLQ